MVSVVIPVNSWVDNFLGDMAIAELEKKVTNIDKEYEQVMSPPEWNVIDHKFYN